MRRESQSHLRPWDSLLCGYKIGLSDKHMKIIILEVLLLDLHPTLLNLHKL